MEPTSKTRAAPITTLRVPRAAGRVTELKSSGCGVLRVSCFFSTEKVASGARAGAAAAAAPLNTTDGNGPGRAGVRKSIGFSAGASNRDGSGEDLTSGLAAGEGTIFSGAISTAAFASTTGSGGTGFSTGTAAIFVSTTGFGGAATGTELSGTEAVGCIAGAGGTMRGGGTGATGGFGAATGAGFSIGFGGSIGFATGGGGVAGFAGTNGALTAEVVMMGGAMGATGAGFGAGVAATSTGFGAIAAGATGCGAGGMAIGGIETGGAGRG